MKYVLDASVAVKWVLNEADSAKAIALRSDFKNQVHELLAPDTFAAEICHALTRAERRKILPQYASKKLVVDVLSTPPVLHEYELLLPRAHAIAMDMRTGFYDCLYVALAERENCEMVTADSRLVQVLQLQFPFVRSLASF